MSRGTIRNRRNELNVRGGVFFPGQWPFPRRSPGIRAKKDKKQLRWLFANKPHFVPLLRMI